MINMNLVPFAMVWVLLAASVIALIVYRKIVASHEDDTLHVLQGEAVSHQAVVAHKLETIDRWGKVLTVVALVYGLVIGALYVYQSWIRASNYLGN